MDDDRRDQEPAQHAADDPVADLPRARAYPQVGPLELNYEQLPIPDADRQTLYIYHAAPGSRSAQSLALLATTIAGEREPTRSTPAA